MSNFPGETPANAASQKPALEPTPACVGPDEGRPSAPPAPALSLADIEDARRPQVETRKEGLQGEGSSGKRQDSQRAQKGQGGCAGSESEPEALPAAPGGPDGEGAAFEQETLAQGSAGNRRRIVLVVVVALVLALAGGAFAVVQGSTNLRGEEFVPDAFESNESAQKDAEQERQELHAQKAVDRAFAALATNEDAMFEACLQRFLDTYDKSLETAPALQRASYGFADLGITAQELTPGLLSSFSCSVKQIDVYDNTAWITLEVTSRSLLEQADVFSRTARLASEDFAEVTEVAETAESAEAVYKQSLKQAYLDAFDGLPARTGQVLVTLPCEGDTWDVLQQVFDQVLAAAWCGNLGN